MNLLRRAYEFMFPPAASTEADYAEPRDYLAEARIEADRILTIEARCYNPETRRALTKHYFGRVGTQFVREPQCLNCGAANPAMVVAQ